MRGCLVVAGGRSTRFGEEDKAVADLAGTPMIRRVVDRVAPVVDELVVNCRTDQLSTIGDALVGVEPEPTVVEDPVPDQGPMMGVLAGLRAVESEYTFVVACDMPFVDPSLVAFLFDRAEGHDAAVPRTDGRFQTTQAVYRTDAMVNACTATLARGERRLSEALSELEWVTIDREPIECHASIETFENLNTAEAFEAAADRLNRNDHGDG